jgi:DNA primase
MGEGEPKYLNSPETPLYNKSKVLYGFDRAKASFRKDGFGVVVEGYLDCIAAHQAGVENVVATSGTALTDEHLRLMARYSPQWTVMFDGDAAGVRAAKRSLELFVAHGLFARGVLLPEGEDPDSYLKKHGADAFRTLLGEAESLMEFFIGQTVREHGGKSDGVLYRTNGAGAPYGNGGRQGGRCPRSGAAAGQSEGQC